MMDVAERRAACLRVIEATERKLLKAQRADGSWKGEFITNPYVDSMDIVFRTYLERPDPDGFARRAAWIRSQQLADGSWASRHLGPGTVTNTVACYVGLRLSGVPAEDSDLQRARQFVRANGGLRSIEPWLAVHLAFLGLWAWEDVPPIPPELLLLPKWAPFSMHDLAWWANVMLVPLSVCTTVKPVRHCGFDIDELVTDRGTPGFVRALPFPARVGVRLSRAYPWYQRVLGGLHRRCLARAERRILAEQDPNGLFGGGLLFAAHFSVIALLALGRPLGDPAIERALEGIDGLLVDEGPYRRVEFCDSSVCDTAVVMAAVWVAAGGKITPEIVSATEYLLDHRTPLGGWGFEDCNRSHPDADNSMVIASAIRAVAVPEHPHLEEIEDALAGAREWVFGVQHESGGWSTFEAARTWRLPGKRFVHAHELVELPTTDVTGHVVEWMALEGFADDPRVGSALAWLCDRQTAAGSWPSTWASNHIFGCYAGIKALMAMGQAGHTRVERAVSFLLERQNEDGGWGEDARSYVDPQWAGRGESTVQHTAIALGALMLGVLPDDHPAIEAGIDYLVDAHSRLGDLWEEPHHIYPLIRTYDLWYRSPLWNASFPVLALGAYVGALDEAGPTWERRLQFAAAPEPGDPVPSFVRVTES